MKIIEQYCTWEDKPTTKDLERIERAGRTCYKSEEKAGEDTEKFLRKITKSGHESVLEHGAASMRFITDRGVTHELVRHRLAAYSQESTRYCNYSGEGVTFILPVYWTPGRNQEKYKAWWLSMEAAEKAYLDLLADKATPQEARAVLPNSLKTEIVMTANFREWRHVLKLRTAKDAHPQMKALMRDALAMFQKAVPVIFDDIDR